MSKRLLAISAIFLCLTPCFTQKLTQRPNPKPTPKSTQCSASIDTLSLVHDWEFRKGTSPTWKPAIVPGTVQEDLIRLGELPDPFYGTNEDSLLLIEQSDWVYRTHFALPESQHQKKHHTLLFNGLDTYADVYLNGTCILRADNMFRRWEVEVSQWLQGDNELKIIFHSPIKKGKALLDQLPYKLPAGNDTGETKVMPVLRKAAFHFGWDWGPRMVTSGIWRPISMLSYDTRIQDFLIIEQVFEGADVVVKAQLDLDSKRVGEGYSYVSFVDGQKVGGGVWPKNAKSNRVEMMFPIKDYDPWWPNGLGTQRLYTLRVDIYKEGQWIDSQIRRTGIRRVELVHEPDSVGTAFYFKVNGHPVFAKGANYIPQQHMTNQVTKSDYRKLLTEAADCHMNMIRVWGGGIYEEDIFYELCDSLGLMVWQDFMFANTMYPDYRPLTDNIVAEIEDNVKRLSHHPSIVHWCGNNEIAVAWNNWGWQKQYKISKTHQAILAKHYDVLFKEMIPNILHNYLPQANYSHTSPISNWGTPENFDHSSMHYWGVFHGEDPFEDYSQNIGRFVSEYGFQTFPNYNLMDTYFPSNSFDLEDPLMAHRQKSYKGNRLIYKHIADYFPVPTSKLELSYLSQLTQAKGISMAIQAHRMDQPRCMGTLYWQLNDCWPAISWSGRDYNGQWKALMHQVKEDYKPVTYFVNEKQHETEIVFVNDTRNRVEGRFKYAINGQNGHEIYSGEVDINLQPGRHLSMPVGIHDTILDNVVSMKMSLDIDYLDDKEVTKRLYLDDMERVLERSGHHRLRDEENLLTKTHWFISNKSLDLAPLSLMINAEKTKDGCRLRLRSDNYVKALYLFSSSKVIHFENNFFDIYPGEEVEIYCTSEQDFKIDDIKWISLNDCLQKDNK